MANCCEKKNASLAALAKSQSRTLWVVFAINLVMFFVEFYFGLVSESSALTADSLDMFSDAVAYGISLYAINMGLKVKAKVSLIKGVLMILMGFFVLARTGYRLFYPVLPEFDLMFGIGFLVLAANLICLKLLIKHKEDDINFKSVWLCSRNDIIANVAVILSSILVYATGSPLADVIVGGGISLLFLKSGFFVLTEARQILNEV